MEKIVRWSIGGLGAIVAAVLAVPAVIDWNGYRGDIAARASHVLGRPVEIRGDLSVAILPTPAVTLSGVHLGNIEGASDADMLSVEALRIELAWAPVLIGHLRVASVKLARPVLNVEIFESGASNLGLATQADGPRRTTDRTARPPGIVPSLPGLQVTPKTDGGFDVSIENFVIEKGAVVYRNAVRGIEERVDELSARVAFASFKGPIEATVRGTVRGLPIAIEVAASEIIQGRTVPFNLDALVVPGGVKAQFSGALTGLQDSLRLRGRLTVDGQNLADLAGALGTQAPSPALRRPFGLQANVMLAGDGADIADLTLRLDNAQANGRINAAFDDKTTIDASLNVAQLDLDSLFREPASTKTDSRAKAPPATASKRTDSGALNLPPNDVRLSLESLPANLIANVDFGAETIVWRGAAILQAKLDVSLANREMTVSQLSAVLPGNSAAAIFGFVTEKDAQPQFDGTVEITSSDLRDTLDWIGLPTRGISAERLRAASLSARLSARPDLASLSELKARVDATQIDGALTATLTKRPSFGANLTVDRIDLDAYASSSDRTASDSPVKPSAGGGGTASGQRETAALFDPVSVLSALGGFDANLHARITAATLKGLPFSDIRMDATLVGGTLDIRSAGISDLAGIAASVSGSIADLELVEPRLRDLTIDAKGKSLANFLRAAEIKSLVSAEALGPVAATLRLNGSIRNLDVTGAIESMGGRATLSGRLDTRQLLPRVDARLDLVYPDAARFVRGLGFDWRPRGVKGGIDLAGNLSGSLFEIGLHEVAGSFAGVRLTGAGAARLPLFGRRPLVALSLRTGILDLDSFFPAKRVAALDGAPSDLVARVHPASFRAAVMEPVRPGLIRSAAREPSKGRAWSHEPLDLSVLTVLDGSFAVTSDALRLGGVTVTDADLDMELQNGLLEIRHLTGKTFGGNLVVDGGFVAEAGGGRFEARYALADADVGAADRAFGAASASRGSATLEGRLRGGGRSPAELVSSLAGEGSIAFKGIDSSDGQGSILGAVGGIAQSLERLGGLRGRLEPIAVNVSGPYRIEGGVIAFDEFAFSSPIGDGGLKGRADLPKWHIAASGEIRLAKDFVIGGGSARPVPFALDGALDAPRLKLDIAALPGGGIQIPLDKLTTRKGATEALKSFVPNRAPKREAPKVESLPPPGSATPPPTATGKADLKADPKPDAKGAAKTEFKVSPKAEAKAEPKAEQKTEATPAGEPKKGERVEDILKDILRGVSR